MAEPQVLHDDYGDAITVEADGIASVRRDGKPTPPAVVISFWDSPFHESGVPWRMRLSGERLAAFTEAVGRHAGYLAALATTGKADASLGSATGASEMSEGWGIIRPGDRKAHYYREGFSLCRRVGFYNGELEADEHPSPDDCAACRKVLDREKAVSRGIR